METAFLPLFVRYLLAFLLACGIIQARQKYALKSWLFVRGAAARFYLCLLRVAFRLCVWHFFFLVFVCFFLSLAFVFFCSLSLCFRFSLSLFLVFVCFFLLVFFFFVLCVLLFPFPFPFPCFLVRWFYFFAFLCYLVSNIYNIIINIIYYIISFVCAHIHARARARQRRGKYKAQKRAAFLCRPLHVIQKIYLNIKTVSVLFPNVCRVW